MNFQPSPYQGLDNCDPNEHFFFLAGCQGGFQKVVTSGGLYNKARGSGVSVLMRLSGGT